MIVRADARALPFAPGSVQCVVTSPPYWNLRDYGTAAWIGGTDPTCDHVADPTKTKVSTGGYSAVLFASPCREKTKTPGFYYLDACGKCGATRADRQLGLEPTPDLYVENLVEVFRSVRRVLRDDGVLFLNLGDSYNNSPPKPTERVKAANGTRGHVDGLKSKDLVGIPWRVAFALQADGWFLRSDIIWSKPNPMPESITDRPTKAHEYVFLLTKSDRYFWDAAAMKERAVNVSRTPQVFGPRNPTGTLRGDVGNLYHYTGLRNIRSVWSIGIQPYKGAHFATMPERLASRCIVAGSRTGDRVLDPFVGSGTVTRCAVSLGRRGLGVDLSASYLDLARDRNVVTMGLPFEDMPTDSTQPRQPEDPPDETPILVEVDPGPELPFDVDVPEERPA